MSDPPYLSSIHNQQINEGDSLIYLLEVNDPDGDELLYFVNSNDNAEISIDNDVLIAKPENDYSGDIDIFLESFNRPSLHIFWYLSALFLFPRFKYDWLA